MDPDWGRRREKMMNAEARFIMVVYSGDSQTEKCDGIRPWCLFQYPYKQTHDVSVSIKERQSQKKTSRCFQCHSFDFGFQDWERVFVDQVPLSSQSCLAHRQLLTVP